MTFIRLPVEVDPQELIDRVLLNLASSFPGWQPNEAHLEVALTEEFARMNVDTRLVAADVSAEIFRKFGQDLLQVVPVNGASATFEATITAIDDAGYTLPAGTFVQLNVTGDEVWYFSSIADAVIDPGETQVTNVGFVSVEQGPDFNGIAAATEFSMFDNVLWVETILSTSESSGGVEAETSDEYLDRLRAELRLLTPRPIHPEDFAVLARRTPGVHRAVAIDGYDPGPPEAFDQERMVAIAAVAENGEAIGSAVKTELAADLDALREVNFVVHVIDPTFTGLDIEFSAKAKSGYDAATVEAAAEEAVAAFIDPARWGGGEESPPAWRLEGTVRYLEIAEVINAVEGIDHITTTAGAFDLTIDATRADVTLDGEAPLPAKVEVGGSTVSGTVTA